MKRTSRSSQPSKIGRANVGRSGIGTFEALEDRCMLAAVDMTDQEQLLLELVNQARADPMATAERLELDLNQGVDDKDAISPDPKQPLAPNPLLIQSARKHSQEMLDFNYFAHNSPITGKTPNDRTEDVGYGRSTGENLAWFGNSVPVNRNEQVYARHDDLFRSPGHRENMMHELWRELGNGVLYGFFTDPESNRPLNSIMVTENFGGLAGDFFITGVAYTDAVVPDDFYTIGESIPAMTIVAVNHNDASRYTTTTGSSGGYRLKVPQGTYAVTGTLPNGASLTYNHVAMVDRQNHKVDFNTRTNTLRSIRGEVFDDRNTNGRRDSNERLLSGQTIYIDTIENDRLDAPEFRTETDHNGLFEIDGLTPGDYRIRIDAPAKRAVTFPDNQGYDIRLNSVHITDVSFGISPINNPPTVVDDEARTRANIAVIVDVTANDADDDGAIDKSSVEVVAGPLNGSTRVDRVTGEVVYIPDPEFTGPDAFLYTVSDDLGAVSETAQADILVQSGVGTLWQNPDNQFDVDANGSVFPLDALLVINNFNEHGARALDFSSPNSAPPPYIDVSGDGFVAAFDALLVLNEINRRQGEAENTEETAPVSVSLAAVAAYPIYSNHDDQVANSIAVKRPVVSERVTREANFEFLEVHRSVERVTDVVAGSTDLPATDVDWLLEADSMSWL